MKALFVTRPNAEVLKMFGDVVGSLQRKVFINEQMAQSLTDLRDTLLPRLISGKLRLPEAQELCDAL